MKPALSIKKLTQKKFKLMNFTGAYKDLIGTPECSGSWLIYGHSGNGKTTFALMLMKYLCSFKKCGYITIEEKSKLSFQKAIEDANLLSVSSKVKIWVDYSVEDLETEISKPKAPDIIFVDSIQYLRKTHQSFQEISKFEYKELIDKYPKKLFVFISHAKKGEPKGSLAEAAYYFSDVCIKIHDFTAIPMKARYGGKTSYSYKK